MDISVFVSRMENNDDAGQQGLSDKGAAAYGLPYLGSSVVLSGLEGEHYDTLQDLLALKVGYDISNHLSLTSITSSWRTESDMWMDWDYSPNDWSHKDVDSELDRISQELRLNYTNGRMKWLLGGYFDQDDAKTIRRKTSDGSVTNRSKGGDTYAVFGNMNYPLTEKLSMGLGARFEVSNRDFEDNITGDKREDNWEDFSPKASLEYAFTPDFMGYLTVAKGYRAGGFNETAEQAKYYSYDPETLWSYEVGAKTTFLDNRLVLNAAVFYMDIEDMQVSINTGKTNLMADVVNAAEATSKGVEIEAVYRPVRGLTLSAGFGYTDISFDEYTDNGVSFAGNQTTWSPEYTFNMGAQYRHPDGWYARCDLIGYGKTYFNRENTSSRDPYELVNLKLGYEWEHFDFYIYGNNIFDENYDAERVWEGGYCTVFSEPGQLGAQLSYRF